ncbi:MAG: 50S ribosomal protein L29 [Nanoarchaeota archaeon]
MKAKELQIMSSKELNEKLNELSKELIKDRATAATGTTPKSPGKMRTSKRTIARIHQALATKQEEAKHA